ncbi:hypothetical protein THAOC_28002, partial [Thalassiosira oceanica]
LVLLSPASARLGIGTFGKSFISLNDALVLARDLGNATSWALMQNLDTQQGRIEEIQKLTTPERVIDSPQDTGLFGGKR